MAIRMKKIDKFWVSKFFSEAFSAKILAERFVFEFTPILIQNSCELTHGDPSCVQIFLLTLSGDQDEHVGRKTRPKFWSPSTKKWSRK